MSTTFLPHAIKRVSMPLLSMGSFFVGGHEVCYSGEPEEAYVLAPNGVPVNINPNGTSCVGQMYVQYLLNAEGTRRPPVVFCHGGSMTGAVWESTPDGQEGWLSDFFRQGWSVYNVDAVERGRSGWAPRDRAFAAKPLLRTGQDCFVQFRIGTAVQDCSLDSLHAAAYPHCQFPLQAFDQFMRQVVPRWSDTDELTLNAYVAMLDCLAQPVILIAHSQGGAFAVRAAEQHPDKVAAIVAIEPAQAGTAEGLAQRRLKDTPILLVYGDNLRLDARWPHIRKRTDHYFDQLATCGGHVTLMDLPAHGIYGNSHLLMLERNNLAISALIQKWLQTQGLATAL
ncbi:MULTISPECIES: alpha/beta hydrolase [unclassified Pseudomonas]|uniref:alpha/beta fold hydrolase n=1 Tax=unclassified Pseudomonas TaxID=196821 RepID=UPI0009E700DC|nr:MULTISPECIES: alpha/beta fold hydrolase [unclassified Pseudomonas]